MKFNHILSSNSTQRNLFSVMEESIRYFLKGGNTTIFAYGQTGFGKSYSTMGNFPKKISKESYFNFMRSREKGLIPQSLEYIFLHLRNVKGYTLSISFYEINNDQVIDLLVPTHPVLPIDEDKNGKTEVINLTHSKIESFEEGIEILLSAFVHRTNKNNFKNEQNNNQNTNLDKNLLKLERNYGKIEGHSVLEIRLNRQCENEQQIGHKNQPMSKESVLRVVDLAPCDKYKISENVSLEEKEIILKEMASVNKTLSCLGQCISALVENSRSQIPFRNSKLTKILRDPLMGNGIIRFIVCINPSKSSSTETLSTLKFVQRIKKVCFLRSFQKIDQNELKYLKDQFLKENSMRVYLQNKISEIEEYENQKEDFKENFILKKENEILKKVLEKSISSEKTIKSKSLCQNEVSEFVRRLETSGNPLKSENFELSAFKGNNKLNIEKNKKSILEEAHKEKGKFKENWSPKDIKDKKKADFEKKIKKFIQSENNEDEDIHLKLKSNFRYLKKEGNKTLKYEEKHKTSEVSLSSHTGSICIYPEAPNNLEKAINGYRQKRSSMIISQKRMISKISQIKSQKSSVSVSLSLSPSLKLSKIKNLCEKMKAQDFEEFDSFHKQIEKGKHSLLLLKKKDQIIEKMRELQ